MAHLTCVGCVQSSLLIRCPALDIVPVHKAKPPLLSALDIDIAAGKSWYLRVLLPVIPVRTL